MQTREFGAPTWARGAPPRPTRLRLPPGLINATTAALRAAGESGREGLVLWAGRPDGTERLDISALIEPEVEGEEDWMRVTTASRAVVVAYLRAHDLLVAADVHSHPHGAFLSAVDALHPYSARVGHLAIVVPSFARELGIAGWRAYELDGRGWIEREPSDVFDAPRL
jgi:proteasome lid subunit RPN8/RPN11